MHVKVFACAENNSPDNNDINISFFFFKEKYLDKTAEVTAEINVKLNTDGQKVVEMKHLMNIITSFTLMRKKVDVTHNK